MSRIRTCEQSRIQPNVTCKYPNTQRDTHAVRVLCELVHPLLEVAVEEGAQNG